MKSMIRHLIFAAITLVLAAGPAFAAQCCDDALAAAAKGKVCAMCAEKDCCKSAIKKSQGDQEKLCKKCTRKADRKKKKDEGEKK